ncbi:putative glucan endo-1,3-beta-D-glucosidase [Arabidopsis thaliana]
MGYLIFVAKAEFGQWCVADGQIPDNVIQAAVDWACQTGGADCSTIQPNQPCFLPNTVKDHASVVFNSYYQRYKHNNGTCDFNSTAFITQTDPSKQLYLNPFCYSYLSSLINQDLEPSVSDYLMI